MVFDPNSGGKFALSRYDFNKHLTGTDFRQPASTIDALPGISGAVNVQASLDNIASFMANVGDATSVSVDISAGGVITLNASEASHQRIKLIGALPNNTKVIIPAGTAVGWVKAIWNATTVSHTVTIAATGGDTGVIIPQSAVSWVYSDGTNAQVFASPINLSDIPPGTNGQVLTTVSGFAAWAAPGGTSAAGGSNSQIQFNNGGVLDGTANATYVGGFLTLANPLQLSNSGFNIQLTAPSLGGSIVLTLPASTDTLVGLNTSDILTNKFMNATSNQITDSGITTGDLFKGNSTKFVRFPMGTSLQVLRTNTGATDLEWATITTNSINTQDFTSNGSWTAPAGVTRVFLIGFGGGGGGGGGAGGGSSVAVPTIGGGGGGGSMQSTIVVTVVPGTQYDIVIGAGGSGGSAGASGGSGTDGSSGTNGGDTSFTTHLGSTLAFFGGAGFGVGGAKNGGGTTTWGMAPGGLSSKGGQNNRIAVSSTGVPLIFATCPGAGGEGVDRKFASSTSGVNSINGFAGGNSGSCGVNSGSFVGGGAGGGGGGGPNNSGGDGGNGGAAANGGTAGTGVSGGVAAAANSGAGGGGGGCAGFGTSGASSSGNGAAGGSGKLTVVWFA